MRLSSWLPVILACTAYTPTFAIPLRGEVAKGWNDIDDHSQTESNIVLRGYIPDVPGAVIARDHWSVSSLYRSASQQNVGGTASSNPSRDKRKGTLFQSDQAGGGGGGMFSSSADQYGQQDGGILKPPPGGSRADAYRKLTGTIQTENLQPPKPDVRFRSPIASPAYVYTPQSPSPNSPHPSAPHPSSNSRGAQQVRLDANGQIALSQNGFLPPDPRTLPKSRPLPQTPPRKLPQTPGTQSKQ